MQSYAAPDEVLVYLISQTINGSNERRLAAKFLLDCLRTYENGDDIAECIDELQEAPDGEVGSEARELAEDLGLIK